MSIAYADDSTTRAPSPPDHTIVAIAGALVQLRSTFEVEAAELTDTATDGSLDTSASWMALTTTSASSYQALWLGWLGACFVTSDTSPRQVRPSKRSDSPVTYSWARRINDIVINRDGDTPIVSPRAIAVARRLAYYSDERARVSGLTVAPVIAPLDDGSVHIEWNRRGNSVHHIECSISSDAKLHMSLLVTVESRAGTVLRATEVRNASMHEVFFAIEHLLARKEA